MRAGKHHRVGAGAVIHEARRDLAAHLLLVDGHAAQGGLRQARQHLTAD